MSVRMILVASAPPPLRPTVKLVPRAIAMDMATLLAVMVASESAVISMLLLVEEALALSM